VGELPLLVHIVLREEDLLGMKCASLKSFELVDVKDDLSFTHGNPSRIGPLADIHHVHLDMAFTVMAVDDIHK